MKVKYRRELKNGKRHVLVELDPDETLLTFDENAHYRLGYPFDEVVRGNNIAEADLVVWDVLEQKWIS